jgi:hypothetical protein
MKQSIPSAIYYLFLSVFALLLYPDQAKAANGIGTEFTYTCTSIPNVYLVKLKIYTDCGGQPICANCPISLNATCAKSIGIKGVSGASAGVIFGYTSLQIKTDASAYDVVQLCTMEKSICTNCGTRTPGTFSPGVEVYTFEGNVNLSALPVSCCEVELFFDDCCRSSGAFSNITTVSYYTKITLNRCVTPCNNSVVYDGDPTFGFCSGVFQTFNNAVHDIDGDSLSFNLGASLSAGGTQAPYMIPYSVTVPFPYLGAPIQSPPATYPSGIYINKYTGAVSAKPMGNFNGNLVVETKEWRDVNGTPTLIGTSRKDYQFRSNTCPSNVEVPFIKYNANGTLLGVLSYENSDSIGVCEGTQICRTYVAVADGDVTDTTNFKWYLPSYMPGASITRLFNLATRNVDGPRHDSIKFCWTPPLGSARSQPYFLNLEGSDNACPMPMLALKALVVYVKKSPYGTIQKSNNMGLNSYKFTYKLNAKSLPVNPSLTHWYVEKLPYSNTYESIMNDSVNNHIFTELGVHKVYVQLQGSGFCSTTTLYDSINVNFLRIGLVKRVDINCKGDSTGSIKFNAVGGTAPYQFRLNTGLWQGLDSFSNLPAATYLAFVRDSLNIVDSMFVNITQPNSGLDGFVTKVNPPCHTDLGSVVVHSINGVSPFLYRKDNDPYVSSNSFINLIDKPYTFQIKDSLGCTFSLPVTIVKPTELQLTSDVKNIQCIHSGLGEVTLNATGATPPYKYQMGNGQFQVSSTFNSLQPGAYTFFVIDTNGCTKSAFIQINEPAQLISTMGKTDATCLGALNGAAWVQVSGGTLPYSYVWRNAPTQQNSYANNLGAGMAHVTVRDSNGCVKADSIQIGYAIPYSNSEICAIATDTSTGAHKIAWKKTYNKGIVSYKIYGSSVSGGTFSLVTTVPFDSIGVYIDTNPLHVNKVWYYKIYAVDSCGNVSLGSYEQSNVFLQITGNKLLNWNTTTALTSALNIKVWRSIDNGAFQQIASFSPINLSYQDNTASGFIRRYFLEVDLMPNCLSQIGGSNLKFLSNMVTVNTTGIKETMMPNQFQIYPNPSNGKLQIGSDRNDLEIASIELYNVQGDKVKTITCEAHTRSLSLDLTDLANGIYQVIVVTPDNTRHNNKLVLNR